MQKHFMLDIETTGIQPDQHDLLQIGCLEVDFDPKTRLWKSGKWIELLVHSDKKPQSEFAKENMAALYDRCNKAEYQPASYYRGALTSFFAVCGAKAPNVFIMGWNASNFDLPFLQHKGILRPSGYVTEYGKDRQVGDTHYRVYEIAGAIGLALNVTGMERETLLDEALKLGLASGVKLPEGKDHDALYDCYKQLAQLNGLIEIMRNYGKKEEDSKS